MDKTMKLRNNKIWAVIVVIMTLAACDGPSDREAAYLERGKALFEERNYIKARLEFRNALQINPRGIEGRFYLARIAEEEQNYRAAFADFTKVVQQEPEYLPAELGLARLYLLDGQIDKVWEKASHIISLQPENADAHALLSTVYLRRNRLLEAKDEAVTALAADPANAIAAAALAGAYERERRYQDALDVLDNVIRLNPENKELRHIKILLHLKQKDFAQVEAVYRELIELSSDHVGYRIDLARFYVSRDRLDDAERLLRDSIARHPENLDLKKFLVSFLAKQHDIATAERQLLEFIEQSPNTHDLRFALASLYLRGSDIEQAKTVYRDIIALAEIGPQGLRARQALARLELESGNKSKAEILIGEVLEVDPLDGTALLMRARLALERDEYDNAIGDLRSVLRADPASTRALSLLAQAQLSSGRDELAIASLRTLLELEPLDNNARIRLAQLTARNRDYDTAIELLDEVLTQAPDTLAALQIKVGILLSRHQWAEAEVIARRILAQPDQQALGHQALGTVYSGTGRHEDAMESYKTALKFKPDLSEALVGMFRSYMAMGQRDQATEYLERYVSDRPNHATAHLLLGQAYALEQKRELAAQAFRRSSELAQGSPAPYLNLAQLFTEAGDGNAAVDFLQQGLGHSPGHESLLFALGSTYERMGDFDAAIGVYEDLVENNSELDAAANNLAALISDFRYEDPEQMQRALQLTQRFETSANPYLLDTFGWVQYRVGNFSQAVSTLERAVERGGDFPQLYYHLGMAYLESDQADKARDALQKASVQGASYPGISTARATLGKL